MTYQDDSGMKELQRTPKEVREMFMKVKKERMRVGKEDPRNPMSFKRFLLAQSRHPNIKLINRDIVFAELKSDKKDRRKRP